MSADAGGVIIREIRSGDDPAWEGWKSIYYDSFPENERMTEGYLLRTLESKQAGEPSTSQMLVMVPRDAPDRVVGIAYCGVEVECHSGYLWYIATQSERRSQGYGALLYSDILRRVKEGGARILLFEVEAPEIAGREGADRAEWARRRIDWYRRQGALLLGGVQYFQSVDAPVPPTEMQIMAHPFESMTPEAVFKAAQKMFGDSIQQTGSLTLS